MHNILPVIMSYGLKICNNDVIANRYIVKQGED